MQVVTLVAIMLVFINAYQRQSEVKRAKTQ